MKLTMKRVLSLTLAMLMCLGVVLPEMAKMPWPLLLPQAQAEETAERSVPSWAYELPQEPLGDERSSGEWRYALRAGDGYAVITGYDGNSANLAAPAKLDGHDVVGIADGAFSHAVAEITLHGNILYMGDSAFGDAQPVIRALNGSYALLWADSHGLPWQNVSTGVFMPDVVDFSDAPSGRVRRRGDAYVQLGQLEAQRVRTGSFIWLTDARGIVFYYRITALTPQGETVLAAVEVPEVGDVVRELSLTQTIDFTDGEFIPAEGAVMIDSPAGTKDRSTSSEPMDGWTVDLSGGFEKALGKKGSDELECRLVASASGTARYTVEVHNGVLTYYETTENEVVNVDASIATRYGVQGDVWNKAFLSKELPLGDVIIMTGFASVTIEINVVLEFEALFSVKYTTVSSTTKNYDFNKEDWVITDRYATVKPGDNCTFDAAATVRVYVEIEATVAVFAIVKILEISFSLGGEAAYSASTARAFPCELLELRVFARVSISAGVWVGEDSIGAKANLLNADLLPKDWLVLRFHLHTVEPVFHRAEDCPFNSVCTVKFEPRNGQKIPSIEVYSGLPIGNNQVPEIEENEYTGKFLGWCTEATGEGVNWEIGSIDGDIVMNDMTLYGIWEKTVPVEFISYADKTLDVQHVPVGGKAVEPAAPQRDGYTFLYWYVQEEGEDRRWYFRDYVVPEEGLTLLAKWRNDETGEEADGDGTTSVMTIGSGASVSTWQDTAEYFKYSIFTVDGKPEGINLTGLTGLATHVRVPSRMTVDVDPSAEVDLESLKVYSISGGIFQGNTNLEAVDFAYQGQISSQSSMFSGCTNLRFVDLRGISMTSVASSMFRGCTSLEKVILPPGIKTIGPNAFYGCASLDSVKLPMGISEVGNYAFSGCTNITKVTLSDSLKSIGVYAFQSCKNLRALDLGDGVTSIGYHAFVDCVSLEEIYLPDSYASFDGTTSYGPFTGCTSVRKLSIGSSNGIIYPYDVNMDSECLEEVIVRGSVHTIKYGCFSNSGEIQSGNVRVILEDGVEVIEGSAFSGCMGIADVVLPSTLKEIGTYAFYRCGNLKKINFGDATVLGKIGDHAFYECVSITDVALADSVKSIGSYAFRKCSALKTLDLGESVTSIGRLAFADCVSLEEIYLPDSYASYNGTTTYGPFTGCKSVRKLNIGSSNGIIYPYDVNMDSACLEEVIIRGSVHTIAYGCFSNSGEMQSGNVRVVLEEGVKTIGTDAFNGCAGITEVVLPSTLREIGTEAFYACTKIKRINLSDATSLQKIGNYAFYKCAGITDVTLADTVMSIGVYAFYNCTGLKKLDLGDGVMTVGNHAFRDCISLEEIYLPDSYASYNGTTTYGPFTGCKSVRKLSIGSSNGIIYPYDVNIDSTRLEEIVIRGSVRTIGYGSFDNAGEARTGSVRLILEEGVQVIESNAFRGCTGITEVVLPSTLKTIGNNAFYGCSGLRTLRISASTTVAGNAFSKKEGMQVHIVGLSEVPEETGRAMTDYFASLGCNVVDAVQPYTLAVSANGGAFEDDVVEIRIQYGWLTVIDAMPQPTNGEHIFSGWFTDEACTQRFTAQTMPARDVTLYAGWDVDVHTVTLNLMGGSLDHALVFPAAAGTNPVAQLTPEMAERSFTGWYLDRYAEIPFDGVMPSKDVTLYAGYVKTGLNGEYVIENGAATLVAYHLVEHESTTVYLPETVEGVPLTRIADGAFDGTAVRVLHLPANLESVSPAAFTGMAKLSAIHVREANIAFKAVNGVLYSADGTVLVCYPAMHGMNGVVPAGVKEVAPYAFAEARLISVTLPEGLEKIGTCAFAGTQLKEVSLPESLRVLGDRAFSGCRELLLVVLGNGLETLGTGVFANTSGMLAAFGPVLNAEGTAPSAAAVWAEENHLLYNYYALKLVAKATYTQRVQAGKPMELPVAAEVGENLYFTGWYADAQCSGDAVAADAVMPKADITLYAGSRAVFTCETMTDEDGAATLTLTGWDARCGQMEVTIPASIGGVPVTAVAGGCFTQEAESITVPPTVTALADGWVPEGWQGQIIAPAGSAAALYAEAAGLSCAEQRWQLTLEVNGGAALPAISAQAGELLLLPVPVRTGCEFAGWYADKALTEAAALTEEGFFAMPGEPATLYAAWTVTDAAAAQLTFSYEETAEGIVVTGLAAGAKTLEIPETLHGLPVVGMSERAFVMQTALTTVKLPGSIGKVPDGAFMGCTALTQAELGEGITELGAECFMHCVSLTSLTLPESLERIGSCALEGTALTTLHLPGGVSWIAPDALSGCNQLASVTAAEDNSFYMSVDGVLYDLLDDKLVKYPAARPGTEYTVMDGTCVIGSHAFSGAPLERITFPESVWALESGAFAGCRSLRALPEMTSAYLNSIPADAFAGCYALREITIPETITAIGDGAFAMCPALVKAAVPESVTKIGLQAFGAGVTIEGRTGSFAEAYAADNRLLFIDPECTVLPESLVISADALMLARGETARLTAAILPENATLSGIRWSSSDSSVVAVSADGEVRALAAGTAQVQAVTANGLTDVCTVTVSGDILVDTLILDADAVTLTETMQHQMVWSILPENASLTTLSWTSADESVCTVDENGLVTALNAGSTTLTATAPGGVSASCTVTVLRRVQEIRLMAEATTVTTGEALSLTWEVLPADAADQTITWRVEPAEYAQCVDGVVTFSRSGYYTVTATVADMNLVSASILVECLADTVWQLPGALCGIEEEAFLGATAEHIVLGGSVVTIGPRAFADCPSLYRIDVPDSVTTIDDSAFEGTSVTIVCTPGSYAQQWAEEHGFPWIIAAE